MALSSENVVIKGHRFEISRLPTSDSLQALGMLLGMAGPTIGAAIQNWKPRRPADDSDESMLDMLLDADLDLAGAVQELTANLSKPGALVDLGELFKGSTRVKVGKATLELSKQYETLFAGELALWAGWVWACLRVNGFMAFLATPGSTGDETNGGE